MLEFEKELKQIEDKIHELEKLSKNTQVDADIELAGLYKKVTKMKNQAYNNMTPWEKVCTARLADRPTALDYINRIFDDFIEFHGDRNFGDDPSIVGGIARLGSLSVTVIGQQKGRTTKENIQRNFGMPHPEGYRKALRLMKQAEKFGRPIICFIDTPGAFCGIGAEERGQGEAIAKNLLELSGLKVPIIAIVIGEGGSGGALAIGVADQVWMFEHSIYSILSPEGFSSILWKDASRAKEAAGVMKLTAQDLKGFGVIEKVIEEPVGGAHKDVDEMANRLKGSLENEMQKLMKMSEEELLNSRYEKLRFSYC